MVPHRRRSTFRRRCPRRPTAPPGTEAASAASNPAGSSGPPRTGRCSAGILARRPSRRCPLDRAAPRRPRSRLLHARGHRGGNGDRSMWEQRGVGGRGAWEGPSKALRLGQNKNGRKEVSDLAGRRLGRPGWPRRRVPPCRTSGAPPHADPVRPRTHAPKPRARQAIKRG